MSEKKLDFSNNTNNSINNLHQQNISISSTGSVVQSPTKDALDLSLPNRSRSNEASLNNTNEMQPLIMKTLSSDMSISSSISPLSSVSNSSSSEVSTNSKPTITSMMISKEKKMKSLKKKKSIVQSDEDSLLLNNKSQINRSLSQQNVDLNNNNNNLQQNSILNSLLLNASTQNTAVNNYPMSQSNPLLNTFPNFFPNLQQQPPFNPALFQQFNSNPFMFNQLNQKQQQQQQLFNDDKSSMNKMFDQLLQYSNYIKLFETYQKNINQPNLMMMNNGSNSNFPFNPTFLNGLERQSVINATNNNNNNNSNDSSQPLALTITNNGL